MSQEITSPVPLATVREMERAEDVITTTVSQYLIAEAGFWETPATECPSNTNLIDVLCSLLSFLTWLANFFQRDIFFLHKNTFFLRKVEYPM